MHLVGFNFNSDGEFETFGRLLAGISQQKPGFNSRQVHVRFFVYKVEMVQIFLRKLQTVRIIPTTVQCPPISHITFLSLELPRLRPLVLLTRVAAN